MSLSTVNRVGVVNRKGGRVQFINTAIPEPLDDQIVIKIKASGVCGTDLQTIDGVFGEQYPFTPGHEGVGIVEKIGRNVSDNDFKIGQHVGIPWLGDACGSCEACDTGKEYICSKQKNTGFTTQGTFAQYVAVAASHTVHLPSNLSFEQAAPILCAGVTAYKALHSSVSGLQPGDWVCILGAAGGLGHLACQYAKAMGFQVLALDAGTTKCEFALTVGSDIALDSSVLGKYRQRIISAGGSTNDCKCVGSCKCECTSCSQDRDTMEEAVTSANVTELVNTALSHTGGHGCHAVINFAPNIPAIEASPLFCRKGGTVVYVAIPKIGRASVDVNDAIFRAITLRGSIVGTRHDLVNALSFASRGMVKSIVHIEPFSAINEVLQNLRKNTYEGRVVLSHTPRESGIA
jgi:propanol-preferring alcohol dehydrogenase